MAGATEGASENLVDEAHPEVFFFKEGISKADGTLLPLRKTTSDGKRLYVAARHLRNPWEYYEVDTAPGYYDVKRKLKEDADTTAIPSFWGWEERGDMPMHPMTGVLLVDVYAEQDGAIMPIGHMDWWLHEDYANGGGNMHQAPIPKNESERLASQRWGGYDYTAFKVEDDYQKQNIGSLMVAASATVLPAIGVRKFYTGALLEPAVKTYERFGIRNREFPRVDGKTLKPFDQHLPIEILSKSPQVNKTISEFVV